MKANKLLFAILLVSICGFAQKSKPYYDDSCVKYLIKNVILLGRDSAELVILPMPVSEIKNPNSADTVQYWAILNKYYPGYSKSDLKFMVANASGLTGKKIPGMPNLHFVNYKKTEPTNYKSLEKQYHSPVCRISNLIYSKDRKTCIVYVYIYQGGSFTVEIKKGPSGKWDSYETITDFME